MDSNKEYIINFEIELLEKRLNLKYNEVLINMDNTTTMDSVIQTFEQGVFQIEVIKEQWLDKQMSLENMPSKVKYIFSQIGDQAIKDGLKQYVENKILLDSNVENSKNIVASTSFTFIPLMISLFSISLSLINIKNGIALAFDIISVILSIAIFCIAFPIFRKHVGKYPREKSFYQIVLKSVQ